MAKILIVDDESSILETLDMFLTEKGHKTYKADTGTKGFEIFCANKPEIVILDIRLPDCNGLDVLDRILAMDGFTKVIMITAFQDMETTIQAMKRGASDYIHKPLDADAVDKAVIRALHILEADRKSPIAEDTGNTPDPEVIIGRSDQMRKIFKMIGLLCQNRATVLVQGETGTGKELIARVIHRNSMYDKEPFVVLDCSSVVESLLGSELFGHEKGAFTGAIETKKGKIELAGNGTLFLDEIGELPLKLQGNFLGFLQRHEYMRVGGQHQLESRCRIIAATNRDLYKMVSRGRFRQDLFFRLRVVTIQVPPLRDRSSDIQDLVNHILRKINLELGTEVTKLQDGIIDCLKKQRWTGNVRELENVLLEAVVRARGSVILLEEIENILSSNQPVAESGLSTYSLSHMEKEHIQHTLAALNWNRTEVARQLEISLPTLRSKIRKYGITEPRSLIAK
jgi:two-component system response regulator AtoC